jgi:hypothetical protein
MDYLSSGYIKNIAVLALVRGFLIGYETELKEHLTEEDIKTIDSINKTLLKFIVDNKAHKKDSTRIKKRVDSFTSKVIADLLKRESHIYFELLAIMLIKKLEEDKKTDVRILNVIKKLKPKFDELEKSFNSYNDDFTNIRFKIKYRGYVNTILTYN